MISKELRSMAKLPLMALLVVLVTALVMTMTIFSGTSEAIVLDVPTEAEADKPINYVITIEKQDEISASEEIQQVGVRLKKLESPSRFLQASYLPLGTIFRSINDKNSGVIKGQFVVSDAGKYELITTVSYMQDQPKKVSQVIDVGFSKSKVQGTLLAFLVILLFSGLAGYFGYGALISARGDKR